MALSDAILLDLPRRTPELGRIRLGEKGERGAPVKLKTFRLTSHSKAILEAAARLYGGDVTAWDGAPDEGMWQITTGASELDILIPGVDGALSQTYEVWKGGTCERRCDGTTETSQDEPRGCVCTLLGQKGTDRDCEIVTRFRVMLPRLPGLGTWMLTTSGYMAATTIPETLGMLAALNATAWIPAVLRAEQRSTRVVLPNGKKQTNRFVVPVLDLPGVTIGQLASGAGLIDSPLIEATVPAPASARDRATAQRALIEARATTYEDSRVLEGTATDVVVTDVPPSQSPTPPTLPPAPVALPPAAGAGLTEICGVVPEDSGVGLTLPCTQPPIGEGHHARLHKSPEGSWAL